MKNFAKCRRSARRKAETINHNQRLKFASQINQKKEIALSKWYGEGGIIFKEWCEKNYITSDGNSLSWKEPFMAELYIFTGHPWFERKPIEKAAQMGFTECLIAFTAFCLGYLHIPLGFGAESRDKINGLVGNRIQPALDYIPIIQELNQEKQNLTKRRNADNKKSISVAGADANFFYANKPSAGDMGRQAGSAISSFVACAIIADELELWNMGILDVAEKRMQASSLPTQPVIAGSTPGAEGGVTATEVKLCQYIFQWYVVCSECNTGQFLAPLGNLLKSQMVPIEDRIEEKFIDPTGRPLDWFYRDKNNKPETAYIGCSHCQKELPRDAIAKGEFRDCKSLISLRDLTAQTLANKQKIERVGLRLPRLASTNFSASKTIKRLQSSDNPIDELQQGLGVPASLSAGKINYEALIDCVGLSLPSDFPYTSTLTILCIDQGKFSHPALVQKWYMSDLSEKKDRWLNAYKEILWYGELTNLNDAITYKAQEYDVDITVMDSEPEYTQATTYALERQPKTVTKNQVYLVDQVYLKGEKYRRKVVQTSTEYQSDVILYSIDRTYALDRVRDRVYRRRQLLPPNLFYDASDRKNNLLAHYLSSERLPSGKWLEGSGDHDHWLMADSFGEITAFIQMYEFGESAFCYTTVNYS